MSKEEVKEEVKEETVVEEIYEKENYSGAVMKGIYV